MNSDPAELLRLALKEYDPELWATLEGTLAVQPICSASEAEVLWLIIAAAKGRPLDIRDAQNRRDVRRAVQRLANTTGALADIEVHRVESLPRNSPDRHS